jgi:type I restriction enzyme R subunit
LFGSEQADSWKVSTSATSPIRRSVTVYFDEKLDALKTPDAKASEMEHAVRHEIHVRLEEDPAFYQSLRDRLEEIIELRKAQRIDAAKQLELLDGIRREIQGRQDTAADLGLSETGLAIYGLLVGAGASTVDEAKRALAEDIEESVEPQTRIVDWTKKDDVQREIRRLIKRKLKAALVPADRVEDLAAELVELLKARKGQ